MKDSKKYESPRLKVHGTVADLTAAGRTNPGSDCQVYGDDLRGSSMNANCWGNQS
ncbi:lasso RiPP family leader peptide-containing protein [Longibacter salinarum]|uniref:lasso RiPP family leader peptide-containing protein n=1 Tax=Longibacter salinarum TaxID=1850348 RepID=UPI00117F3942